jgi:hypothetical protein
MVFTVGRQLVSAAAMEKALEAAWIVIQITEAEPKALIGLAGEAAAEALLGELLGVDPKLIRNLNNIEANFPVVDLISPRWIASVKTRGVLSTLTRSELTDQLRSQYTSDLLDIVGRNRKAQEKLDLAADALFRNKRRLAGSWPRDLTDTSRAGIRRYIQEKSLLLVPNDHVQSLRKTLGSDLYRRLNNDKSLLAELGIRQGNDRALAKYITRQIKRIAPMGVSSSDLRMIVETARTHLPADVTRQWRPLVDEISRQRRLRGQ